MRINIVKVGEFVRSFRAKHLRHGKREVAELRLGPIVTSFVVRPIASFVGGFVVAFPLYVLDVLVGGGALTVWYTLLIALFLALWFGMNEDETLVVPNVNAALVTFFGFKTFVYLYEGKYPWTGRRLGFGRYTGKVPGLTTIKKHGTQEPLFPFAEKGFFYTGQIVLPIWNKATDVNTVLSNVARDSSTVRANLTIVAQFFNFRRQLSSSEPIFDIAERSRETFRTSIAAIIGVDCNGAKDILRYLMRGFRIVTCFTREQFGSCDKQSILQDDSGKRMYRLVEQEEGDKDIETATTRTETEFIELVTQAAPKMLEVVPRTKDTNVPVTAVRSIDDSLDRVIDDVGARLIRVSISDFELSQEVEAKANRASGEAYEREIQEKSAKAVKAYKNILKVPKGEERDDLATLIAAASDNENVKIVVVPGGDRLTKAAVAGGAQIGSN